MKKTTRILLPLLLILCLLFSLTGCGAKSEATTEAASAEDSAPIEEEVFATEETEADAEAPAASAPGGGFVDGASGTESGEAQATAASLAEKIIYSGYLYIETTDFDSAMATIDQMVQSYGGFVESSNIYGNTEYQPDGTSRIINRNVDYQLRIPCAHFHTFMQSSGNIGNVLNTSTTADNITSQFSDTEARKESLLIQEERLLDMMGQTTEVESLIELESRLSEVRYEIEALERQLINWQNSVDYSTINLSMYEVEIYTPVATRDRTFGEKMSDAFFSGWRNFSNWAQDALISLTAALPTLLLLAVITALIIFLIRRGKKRREAHYRPVPPPPVPPQPPTEGNNPKP